MSRRIPVWDAPVRLFHWALAGLVVFSYVTAKAGGYWLEWHMRSGYTILSLLAFRLAWGFVGSDTARFASFLRGPGATLAYARATLSRRHPVVVGHNPMGGWMVLAMLAILATQAFSGLFVDDEIATQGPLAVKASGAFVGRMSALHDFNEWLLVGMVALHVAAIAAYRWVLGVRLVGPMIRGAMEAPEGVAAPRQRSPALAAALFAAACGAVYWLVVVFPRSAA